MPSFAQNSAFDLARHAAPVDGEEEHAAREREERRDAEARLHRQCDAAGVARPRGLRVLAVDRGGQCGGDPAGDVAEAEAVRDAVAKLCGERGHAGRCRSRASRLRKPGRR